MSTPVNRTILLFDIEKFSDRDDVEQGYLRRMLYGVADRVLEKAEIDESLLDREDRGDGILALIDPNASLTALLQAILTAVPAELRTINRMASDSAQIRLRLALDYGFVTPDEHGWGGSALNHTFRLLDADVLHNALKERSDDFALCVSDRVYHDIVRHDHPGIPAEEFHAVTVASKNGPLSAWLHGKPPAGVIGRTHVGGTGPGDALGRGVASPPAPIRESAAFDGAQVGGDQYGVSGGTVHGDVVIGEAAFRRNQRGDRR